MNRPPDFKTQISLIRIALVCFMLLCGRAQADIHEAAAIGDVEQLKKDLAENPELISARSGPNRTPLCIAAMCGQTKAVEFLIAQGAKVDEGGFRELTPLADMTANGITNDQKCAEIAAVLLAHGAEVDSMDAYATTPLLYAVQLGKSRPARVLLEHGANPTFMYNGTNSGVLPLRMAIRNRDKEMVKVLLNFKAPFFNGADADAAALRFAESLNEPEIVAMLRREQAASALPLSYSIPPTADEMRTRAKQIAEGYDRGLDDLAAVAGKLYGEIKDYQKENDRVMLLLFRMKAVFDVLGDEAGKDNAKALQALKRCLGIRHLKSFAPDALGIAAAGGNKEALDILLDGETRGIDQSAAIVALCLPAKANMEPAVDYVATWLGKITPWERNNGVMISATNALADAAAKGNKKAQEALEKLAATDSSQKN